MFPILPNDRDYVIISDRMVICLIINNRIIKDLTGKMRRLLKNKIGNIFGLIFAVVALSFVLSGCGPQEEPQLQQPQPKPPAPAENVNSNNQPSERGTVNINVEDDDIPSRMISYDVQTVGRSNPFMPYNEMVEYERVRNAAIAEANAKNAQIAKLKNLQDYRVREQDDISPYSFNLPVPPTSLDTNSFAAKITRTKVVGIMFNTKSPSAIINVDNKDYLVRPGDKIIGQEYKVVKITPTWVTAAMGSNVYSAAIGELFTKDAIETNQTDIYNLKERFGGRKI